MMQIKEIELTKKFTAIFKGVTAKVIYNIREDWFSVYYFRDNKFITKNVHETTSEQLLLKILRNEINGLI